jgi:tRNA pseudouridine55 synthase
MNTLESGFLVIDKPEGPTSHDVVDQVRRLLQIRRVGHLGTLDPMATGVLPVAFGKATRLIQFLSNGMKVYQGTIQLGFSTSTFDRVGQPTSSPVKPAFTVQQLEEVSGELSGEQWQVPPPFSAKKIQGVRAYRLARQGKLPDLKPRHVVISRLALERLSATQIGLQIYCSAGTYVRSVAHEIGSKLGCGAHLVSLRRLASGEFRIERAVSLDTLCSSGRDTLRDWVVPMSEALKDVHGIVVGAETAKVFIHGGSFAVDASLLGELGESPLRVLSNRGVLLGLAEMLPETSGDPLKHLKRPRLRPKVVLVDQGDML